MYIYIYICVCVNFVCILKGIYTYSFIHTRTVPYILPAVYHIFVRIHFLDFASTPSHALLEDILPHGRASASCACRPSAPCSAEISTSRESPRAAPICSARSAACNAASMCLSRSAVSSPNKGKPTRTAKTRVTCLVLVFVVFPFMKLSHSC